MHRAILRSRPSAIVILPVVLALSFWTALPSASQDLVSCADVAAQLDPGAPSAVDASDPGPVLLQLHFALGSTTRSRSTFASVVNESVTTGETLSRKTVTGLEPDGSAWVESRLEEATSQHNGRTTDLLQGVSI